MNKYIILDIVNYFSGRGVEIGCDNINVLWIDSLKKKERDKLIKLILRFKYLD